MDERLWLRGSRDTITSGIEGAWTANPIQWDNGYFDMLFKYEDSWVLEKSPAGAHQWTPSNQEDIDMAPDAEDSNMKVPTMMTTADMAMIRDGYIQEDFKALP